MTCARHLHAPFRYADPSELLADAEALGLRIPWSDRPGPVLSQPLPLGGRTIPNRCVALPMEGFDAGPDGAPTDRSRRRYARYAEGGFGMVWVEACAVAPEARTNPGQFWIHPGSAGRLRELVDATRAAARAAGRPDPFLALQLTHSGRFSKPEGKPAPRIAVHHPALDARFGVAPDLAPVTDEELCALPGRFAAAARLARDAGFDAVDVKACHGYLFAELLAARPRPGKFGGPLENRARVLLDAVRAVRAAAPELAVVSRLGIHDPHAWPGGFGCAREDPALFDFAEPFRLIGWLAEAGVSLLGLTIGNPYYHPHFNRPYDVPLPGAEPPPEHPLVGVARCLAAARMTREAFPGLPVVGFGLSWLRQWWGHVGAGALATDGMQLVGQGRGAFADPGSVGDLLAGRAPEAKKACVTCSRCTQNMREGRPTGCVIRHREIFRNA